jgi:hypothetical protein
MTLDPGNSEYHHRYKFAEEKCHDEKAKERGLTRAEYNK